MKVVEIFTSIEGEGARAGLPATFIRLFGCNLRCTYCDSAYAHERAYADEAKEMTIDEIIQEVQNRKTAAVTVTGGEPLIHNDIKLLLNTLIDNGCNVNVETNGTVIPPVINSNIFYTMDFKTHISGMSKEMNPAAFKALENRDVVKCVVASKADMLQAQTFLDDIYGNRDVTEMPQIYFSPVWGKIEPKEIVEYLLENQLFHIKVQLQLHKLIWSPDRRGV